jgi:hypothetical protein
LAYAIGKERGIISIRNISYRLDKPVGFSNDQKSLKWKDKDKKRNKKYNNSLL